MAKKQYLISQQPPAVFPAFNPAIVTIQASGYAVQEAQAIIDSGVFPQGTNLLRYLTETGTTRWSVFGSGASLEISGDVIKGVAGSTTYPWLKNSSTGEIEWDMAKEYTISFYIRSSHTGNRQYSISNSGNTLSTVLSTQTIAVSGEWTRIEKTFNPLKSGKVSDTTLNFSLSTYGEGNWVEIKGVKIELGVKATAWTPSPYDIVAEYDPNNFLPKTVKVTPDIPNTDIGTVTIGVATQNEGEYEGDISKIARSLFRNVIRTAPAAVPAPSSPVTWIANVDYNLRADMSVENVGSYTALNAVRQFNKSLLFNKMMFCINSPVIQYPGFPLSVAVVNGDFYYPTTSNVLLLTTEGSSSLLAATQEPHVVLDVPAGTNKVIAMNTALGTVRELNITQGCVADNPFYVRWINTIGGYDYHMFNNRKQIEEERADTVNVQLADTSDETDTQVTASFKIEKRITSGVDNLPLTEYTKVTGIVKSPRIQWWDADAQVWTTLLCTDLSNIWDTNSGLGSVELTFIFPRTLLQM